MYEGQCKYNNLLIRGLIIILKILTLTVGLVNLHHQLLGNVHYILLRYLQENRLFRIQLNISTMGTFETEEKSGHCREVLNKSQCMFFFCLLGQIKSGHCRELAISEGSTVLQVLYISRDASLMALL